MAVGIVRCIPRTGYKTWFNQAWQTTHHALNQVGSLASNQALVSLRKASWRVVAHADSILAAWACYRALAAVSVIVLALRLDDGVVQLEAPACESIRRMSVTSV